MLSQAQKLLAKVAQIWTLCGAGTGMKYTVAVVTRLPAILKRRDLQPADAAMTGEARLTFRNRPINVPYTAMDAVNTISGDGPSFAGIREILGDQVYLRGFTKLGNLGTFVDLGANRGMVTTMAASGLVVPKIVAVEAQAPYSACFSVLADANNLTPDQRHRVVKFAGAKDDESTITVDGLCQQYDIEHIDFLKCDIEGGENEVVLGGAPAFWHRVRLVAMELHPEADTRTDEIIATMIAEGFHVSVTDPDGKPIETILATYLYASRDPSDLALPIAASPM